MFTAAVFHNNQNIETTQVLINKWMNKQNEVYTYNGILLGYKVEWTSAICYSIDGPWKNYVKWNKPNIKEQILLVIIYELSRHIHRNRKQICGAGGNGEWEVIV